MYILMVFSYFAIRQRFYIKKLKIVTSPIKAMINMGKTDTAVKKFPIFGNSGSLNDLKNNCHFLFFFWLEMQQKHSGAVLNPGFFDKLILVEWSNMEYIRKIFEKYGRHSFFH